MRIAYALDQLLPNRGADTEQVMNTVSALLRRGVDVVLYLPRPVLGSGIGESALRDHYRLDRPPPVAHLRVPLARVRSVVKIGHALRVMGHGRLREFDLVYSRNLPVVAGALAAGHRVIYETYRPWPAQKPATAPAFRALMQHRNFVGAVLHSAFARSCYLDLGLADDRLQVVHNGYEPRLFEPRLDRAEARAALGLPRDRTIAVYSGRLTLQKGLGLVLDMAARRPEVCFVLVGSEGQGPVEERARALPNVRVAPWQPFDRIAPYLYAADVLLIPPSLAPLTQARNTVLPIKLFSYLAAGRPILAAESPDTAEILSHGHNAWLVRPDDLDAALQGLDTLVTDPRQAARLGQRSLELAQALTWDARAAKLVDFIEGRLRAMGAARRAS